MPRIRYLKPEFFIDDDIASLPYAIRIFYQGLWCHADKEGRLEDRPAQLKVQIMPYDKIDAGEFLNELSKKPFIQRYEISGSRYIQILAWHKHQKPHHTEKDSIIPAPLTIPNNKDKDKDKATRSELRVKQPLFNRYGEYNHVFLTQKQYEKLFIKFGNSLPLHIKRLDEGIQQYGYKYKDCYLTILDWNRKNPIIDNKSKEQEIIAKMDKVLGVK
jgi:hypothetical protein